jgi:nicotinamidase-related amidase
MKFVPGRSMPYRASANINSIAHNPTWIARSPILTGLLSNTCLEATGRIGIELGYHVTLVRDAISARLHEALHAAMDIDGLTHAHKVSTTTELIAAITSNAT